MYPSYTYFHTFTNITDNMWYCCVCFEALQKWYYKSVSFPHQHYVYEICVLIQISHLSYMLQSIPLASQVALAVKKKKQNLSPSVGDARDAGLIPGSGRSPWEGHGNPLYYSCLENPMDRGAWWATVHGVTRVGHDLATKERERWQNNV